MVTRWRRPGETKGWTFTVFEEAHIYGFPHEMRHFIQCILNDETPQETGEDGRATLEIIYAAYESAGTGKKITWPYKPRNPGEVPVNAWLKALDTTRLFVRLLATETWRNI